MCQYKIQQRKIAVDEYQSMRNSTDWKSIDDELVKKALENDLFSICVLYQDKVVGIGRVVGDGAIYFYLQDIIVLPEYQGKGVGSLIMDAIEKYLDNAAHENSFIGLMAASGVIDFYRKYGFSVRPEDKPGMYKMGNQQR